MKPNEETQYKFLHATRGFAWFNEKNIELSGGIDGMARTGWTLVEDTLEKQPLPANVSEIMKAGQKKTLESQEPVQSPELNAVVEENKVDPNGDLTEKKIEVEKPIEKVVKKGGRPKQKKK
jgi:hypothetical protein